MRMIPSAADERAMAVNARFKKVLVPAAWHGNHPLLQLVLFGLTCVGVIAMGGMFNVAGASTAIGGVLAIAVAEVLVVRGRFWRTGVEVALWIGGAWLIVFGLEPDSIASWLLAFGATSAIAWLRVRYALFAALAVVLILAGLEVRGDDDVVLLLAGALVVIALAGLARMWRRPSSEWFFIVLLLVTPVVAFFAAGRDVMIALYLPFAIVCLVVGIRLRHHAPLLASMIGVVIVASEVHRWVPLAIEVQLAIAGAFLLGTSWLVARALREKTRGIVVEPAKLTEIDELLETGIVISTAPQPPPPEEGRVQGDGSFGGAGATGDY